MVAPRDAVGVLRGAMGGTRTHNPFRKRDFESRAYTIPPPWPGDSIDVSQEKMNTGAFVSAPAILYIERVECVLFSYDSLV